MPSHMDDQIIVPYKTLPAFGTEELFGMLVVELHVFGQMRFGKERFFADFALELILAVVAFHVHVPVFFRGKTFLTDIAVELFLAHYL